MTNGMKCPRCGYNIRNFGVPRKEDHQEEWSRAFETWTRDEYLTLARMYQDEDAAVLTIAVELERPPNAIVKRIKDLGLYRPEPKLPKPEPEPEVKGKFDEVPEVDDTEKNTYVK